MNVKVLRPNLSNYFSPLFRAAEKGKLESLKGVSYIQSWDESPDVLLSNTTTEIDNAQMGNASLIIHANSGREPYDQEFVENFPGLIVMGNIIRVQAVVQYIMSCIFKRYSTPPFTSQWDRHRHWNRSLLEELKILIIGYGHIGRQLTSVLNTLDVTPDIYDPWQGYEQLDPAHAEMIILCCSGGPHNKHLINGDFLNQISPRATIINSARGHLIDEHSLVHFLENNPHAFAFLDVHEQEPFPDKRFGVLSNVATSSHIAGVFQGIEQKIINFEYNVLRDFVSARESFAAKYSKLILSPRGFPRKPDLFSLSRVGMSPIDTLHEKTEQSSIPLP